jgi:hypothetical protein
MVNSGYGPTSMIRVKDSHGVVVEIKPSNGSNFVIGEDIGAEFTDQRVLRMLRVDPRFQEI